MDFNLLLEIFYLACNSLLEILHLACKLSASGVTNALHIAPDLLHTPLDPLLQIIRTAFNSLLELLHLACNSLLEIRYLACKLSASDVTQLLCISPNLCHVTFNTLLQVINPTSNLLLEIFYLAFNSLLEIRYLACKLSASDVTQLLCISPNLCHVTFNTLLQVINPTSNLLLEIFYLAFNSLLEIFYLACKLPASGVTNTLHIAPDLRHMPLDPLLQIIRTAFNPLLEICHLAFNSLLEIRYLACKLPASGVTNALHIAPDLLHTPLDPLLQIICTAFNPLLEICHLAFNLLLEILHLACKLSASGVTQLLGIVPNSIQPVIHLSVKGCQRILKLSFVAAVIVLTFLLQLIDSAGQSLLQLLNESI